MDLGISEHLPVSELVVAIAEAELDLPISELVAPGAVARWTWASPRTCLFPAGPYHRRGRAGFAHLRAGRSWHPGELDLGISEGLPISELVFTIAEAELIVFVVRRLPVSGLVATIAEAGLVLPFSELVVPVAEPVGLGHLRGLPISELAVI